MLTDVYFFADHFGMPELETLAFEKLSVPYQHRGLPFHETVVRALENRPETSPLLLFYVHDSSNLHIICGD